MTQPFVPLVSTNPSFFADEFNMAVLASVVQQVAKITLKHEFVEPGEAGIEDASRWGYRIKATDHSGVFRSYVPPMKLAEGLRAAMRAGGIEDDKAVLCTEKGVWIDGALVSSLINGISKNTAPVVDSQEVTAALKNAAKGLGGKLVDEKNQKAIELDWDLPSAKAFLESLRSADFSKGGRKI